MRHTGSGRTSAAKARRYWGFLRECASVRERSSPSYPRKSGELITASDTAAGGGLTATVV